MCLHRAGAAFRNACLAVSLFLCGVRPVHQTEIQQGALDGRAVLGLMQTMERERTAYEYQEGSV